MLAVYWTIPGWSSHIRLLCASYTAAVARPARCLREEDTPANGETCGRTGGDDRAEGVGRGVKLVGESLGRAAGGGELEQPSRSTRRPIVTSPAAGCELALQRCISVLTR